MVFYWGFLIFLIVVMAITVGFSYVKAVENVGRKAARISLRYTLLVMLLTLALTQVIPFLEKYGLVRFHILFSVGVSVGFLAWIFRKKESGDLIINLGRTPFNRVFFRLGLLQAFITIAMTCLLLLQGSAGFPQSTSLELQISQIVDFLTFAILFLAFGLSRFEFRENGIYFMFILFNWQRVHSYNWEESNPNRLTIWFKPPFLLYPGFLSMPIPTKHRDAVNQILDERLPGKNL